MERLSLELEDFEETCSHGEIVPYGDGTDGRCTKCGMTGFPVVDAGDPEGEDRRGLVMVLRSEDRDLLLDRLRQRAAYRKP